MTILKLAGPLVAGVLGLTSLTGAVEAANPMVGGEPMYTTRNIVENAVNSPDHTTLVTAVVTADLAETLQGEGPFTVFAPTNEAFGKLPAGTVEALLQPQHSELLKTVLACHVVPVRAMSDAIQTMIVDDGGAHPVKTLGGCVLMAKSDGQDILLEDENGNVARVTIADVRQSNGVIHVIDTVLLPKM